MGGNKYKQMSSKKRCSRKRSFKGNIYAKSQDVGEDVMSQQTEQEVENINVFPTDEQSVSVPSIKDSLSSSTLKIDMSFYDSMAGEGTEGNSIDVSGHSQIHKTSCNINTSCMYMLTDISIFLDLLQLVGRCPDCCSNIDNTVDFLSKKGFAQKVIVNCKDCGWSYSTYLPKSLKTDESSRYDVNLRSIIAF